MKMNAHLSIGGVAVGGIATLALAFSPIDRAQAATITTLYNTGVNASGVVLPDVTIDSHYALTSYPTGTNTTVVARTTGYPAASPWQGPNSTSAWVGPYSASYYGPSGSYTYKTTFDLTGFIASSANIVGQWSTDNNGTDIKLNGVSVGLPASSLSNSFSTFTPFTISSGFVSGINTLEFVLTNGPVGVDANNPTGLRVELAGTANTPSISTTAVPEPADLVGTAIAFGSVVLLKRNLSKKTVKLDSISK